MGSMTRRFRVKAKAAEKAADEKRWADIRRADEARWAANRDTYQTSMSTTPRTISVTGEGNNPTLLLAAVAAMFSGR